MVKNLSTLSKPSSLFSGSPLHSHPRVGFSRECWREDTPLARWNLGTPTAESIWFQDESCQAKGIMLFLM